MKKNKHLFFNIFNYSIRKHARTLSAITDLPVKTSLFPWLKRSRKGSMLGWGLKPSGLSARKYGKVSKSGFLLLEDGFLRSLGLGVAGYVPHSLVLDHSGIYYDATCSSDLEARIAGATFEDAELHRARDCIDRIARVRLSKYNHAPDRPLFIDGMPRVLVIDQTFGDASVSYGCADDDSFVRMLDEAIANHPEAEVLVKIHPDVLAGKKQGYLFDAAKERKCRLVAEDINPWALFDVVEHVYVVTSQLGFEALIAGLPVTCFGLPFYAGWGLTEDRQACDRRGVSRTLEQVFAAAYLNYARYINPYTGQRCELEDTINLISDQRYQAERLRGKWIGVGFSRWKRHIVNDFVGPASHIDFENTNLLTYNTKSDVCGVLGWSSRIDAATAEECERNNIPLWHMEDGFIRSVGLGADLVRPMSLVIDSRGIYYDASRPSDLEHILASHPFPQPLLKRARYIRDRLVELGLSKYNTGSSEILDLPDDRRLILVPGQVESDASIARGSPVIRTNQALLAAVRSDNPDAFIIYKPHPDVLSGGRMGDLPRDTQHPYDLLVTDIAMPALLQQVHEVHTMSSLTGFEALLRGVKVFTYGLPFYAGWGLTTDKISCERRNRKLTLDQLVAGTLILYPTYVEPDTGQLCNIETIIELIRQRQGKIQGPSLKTRFYRFYRKIFEKVK